MSGKIIIVKGSGMANEFWTGTRWSKEYPDAHQYNTEPKARQVWWKIYDALPMPKNHNEMRLVRYYGTDDELNL